VLDGPDHDRVDEFGAGLEVAVERDGVRVNLRSALVNTFHELGRAAGAAILSSAAGAALIAAHPASADFTHAFTVGAVCAAASVAIAALLVPAVHRKQAP
jgi:hypothetical protein